jgi:hypothetical protein
MWIGYQKNQMDQMDQIVDQKDQIGICILITEVEEKQIMQIRHQMIHHKCSICANKHNQLL